MKREARKEPLSLTAQEREQIIARLSENGLRRCDFMRLSIVLMLADGVTHAQIVQKFEINPSTVGRCKRLFNEERLAGLLKPRGPGRQRKYGRDIEQKILDVISSEPPNGRVCWTVRLIVNRIEGVHYQYVWNFIRNRRVDLCTRRHPADD